jgi:ubiquinone biosynthesis protein UbiJ
MLCTATYNPVMFFQSLLEPLGREALARTTLLLNHVLAAEPEATRRLQGQIGRSIALEWRQWPGFLPPPPRPVWTITPAGLLDLTGDGLPPAEPAPAADSTTAGEATLTVSLGSQELLRWLSLGAGGRPPMDIRGDAALAAEVSWLADHLRWDLEDDLARLIGDAPAHQLARLGRLFADTLRGFVQQVSARFGVGR